MKRTFMTNRLTMMWNKKVNYGYIVNYYRLIAVNLKRQRELDADQEVIMQM